MNQENEPSPRIVDGGVGGFFKSLFVALLRDFVKLVLAFAVGTGAGAAVCWYYGLPLALSIVGGILVLGVALALQTDSLFS